MQPDNRRTVALTPASELHDLQPALKQRLALGHWSAIHLRIAELHRGIDPATRGGAKAVEAVPPGAVWGFPDWLCLHEREGRPLVIELKSERGRLTPEQRAWLRLWRQNGAEVAVVRPQDVLVPRDALYLRLVERRQCELGELCDKAVCTGWCRALKEAASA